MRQKIDNIEIESDDMEEDDVIPSHDQLLHDFSERVGYYPDLDIMVEEDDEIDDWASL